MLKGQHVTAVLSDSHIITIMTQDPTFKLEKCDESRFDEYKVESDTNLRKFIDEKASFKRGAAFFQFMCPEEDVLADREVVLKHNVSYLIY